MRSNLNKFMDIYTSNGHDDNKRGEKKRIRIAPHERKKNNQVQHSTCAVEFHVLNFGLMTTCRGQWSVKSNWNWREGGKEVVSLLARFHSVLLASFHLRSGPDKKTKVSRPTTYSTTISINNNRNNTVIMRRRLLICWQVNSYIRERRILSRQTHTIVKD